MLSDPLHCITKMFRIANQIFALDIYIHPLLFPIIFCLHFNKAGCFRYFPCDTVSSSLFIWEGEELKTILVVRFIWCNCVIFLIHPSLSLIAARLTVWQTIGLLWFCRQGNPFYLQYLTVPLCRQKLNNVFPWENYCDAVVLLAFTRDGVSGRVGGVQLD